MAFSIFEVALIHFGLRGVLLQSSFLRGSIANNLDPDQKLRGTLGKYNV